MPPRSQLQHGRVPVQVQWYPERFEPNRDDCGRHAKKEPRSPPRGSFVRFAVSGGASGCVCLLGCSDLGSELVELRGRHGLAELGEDLFLFFLDMV